MSTEHTISILCELDVDTGAVTELHRFPYLIEAPNWLKDGSLYYNSKGRIYRYLPDKDESEALNTGHCTHCNNDHVPSPNHRLLAVSESKEEGLNSRIYITDPKTGACSLATPDSPSFLHGWSPDGTELAYCAFRDHGDGCGVQVDVYTIQFRADGSSDPVTGSVCGKEQRCTFGEGFNDGPEYSPDGRHIWFNSTRSGLMQIWRMNRDGSDPRQMTSERANNWFAHVSPDGSRVVYLSFREGDLKPEEHLPNKQVRLCMMNYDGSDAHTLLELFGGQGTINVNSWSPDGKKIAFVKYEA